MFSEIKVECNWDEIGDDVADAIVKAIEEKSGIKVHPRMIMVSPPASYNSHPVGRLLLKDCAFTIMGDREDN